MLKKVTIFLLILLIINCLEVPDRLKDVCPKGCKRYFYCDENAKKCVFKGFFPLYPLELLELFILMVSSSLATSCGIGGGTVYSSMILGVEELEPSQAFPVSNFLILFCGLVTFISFTLDKYKHPKNKFIHYDIATIFAPSMLVGAKFGAILNKILPSSLLLILLCFLICYTTKKTYYNILKAKAKEEKLINQEKSEENKNANLLGAFKEMQKTNNDNNDNEKLETKNNDINSNTTKLMSSIITSDNNDKQDIIEFSGLTKGNIDDLNNLGTRKILTDEDLKIINEDDDPLNWERINYILFLEAIVIVDQLIEGSNRVPSFFGIQRCSFSYWFCFLVYVGIALYFVRYSIDKVYEHIAKKKSLIPDFTSEVIDNVEKNITYVISISIIAGIVSSSLGIGGGMITNPAFASLGMDPKQSSSTSNFLIIVTAIASSFIFILSGQLEIGYSICLGAFCTAAALIGSFYILKYINQTGRSSILLVIMEYFLIASLFITIYKLLTLDLKGHSFIGSLFVTNKYC
jgi:uncharacterized membrane protein YfcA